MQTLRLLRTVSPQLLDLTLQNYLSALRSSSNLSLPLTRSHAVSTTPKSDIDLVTGARLETAARALEVAERLYMMGETKDGNGFGSAVINIIGALNEGVVGDIVEPSLLHSGSAKGDAKAHVWESGMRRILEVVQERMCNPRFTLALDAGRIAVDTDT